CNALDAAIDGWRRHGVVGMKTAIAYTSGLAISDPPLVEARTAFGRKRSGRPIMTNCSGSFTLLSRT
ncbi:MAG TPA: hypothetical protein VM186_02425, partial [Planctomycetota bacterium]|nr:hypothetical protein [Planctomycetota bacterium]